MSGQVLGKFFNNYSGKDKFARTIQYASRFVEVRLAKTNPDSALGARLLKLHKNLSINRKAFRLCRWVNDYQKLKKAWTSEEPDVFKKLLRIIAEFGFMIYAMHDNVNWARAINIIDVEHQPIKDRQTYFRLTGAFAEFSYRLIVIRDNWEEQKKARSLLPPALVLSDTLEKLEAEQAENFLKASKFFFDVVTYLRKPLKQCTGIVYAEEWLCLSGLLASLFGMRSAWIKAAKE